MINISCVIPIYNEGNILHSQMKYCIEELTKECDDVELILVNDGSKDQTEIVIEELEEKYSIVKSLNNDINMNMGVSVLRGFRRATKEFVTFNAVDLPLEPQKYRGLIQYMIDENIDLLVVEREEYLGTSFARRIMSKINRGFMWLLFPKLKSGIHDTNYVQIVKKDCVERILPLARSPIFTWPEMIFRARLAKLNVKTITVEYNPRVVRKGAFGKPHDIIWGIYDMLRFRILVWKKKI